MGAGGVSQTFNFKVNLSPLKEAYKAADDTDKKFNQLKKTLDKFSKADDISVIKDMVNDTQKLEEEWLKLNQKEREYFNNLQLESKIDITSKLKEMRDYLSDITVSFKTINGLQAKTGYDDLLSGFFGSGGSGGQAVIGATEDYINRLRSEVQMLGEDLYSTFGSEKNGLEISAQEIVYNFNLSRESLVGCKDEFDKLLSIAKEYNDLSGGAVENGAFSFGNLKNIDTTISTFETVIDNLDRIGVDTTSELHLRSETINTLRVNLKDLDSIIQRVTKGSGDYKDLQGLVSSGDADAIAKVTEEIQNYIKVYQDAKNTVENSAYLFPNRTTDGNNLKYNSSYLSSMADDKIEQLTRYQERLQNASSSSQVDLTKVIEAIDRVSTAFDNAGKKVDSLTERFDMFAEAAGADVNSITSSLEGMVALIENFKTADINNESEITSAPLNDAAAESLSKVESGLGQSASGAINGIDRNTEAIQREADAAERAVQIKSELIRIEAQLGNAAENAAEEIHQSESSLAEFSGKDITTVAKQIAEYYTEKTGRTASNTFISKMRQTVSQISDILSQVIVTGDDMAKVEEIGYKLADEMLKGSQKRISTDKTLHQSIKSLFDSGIVVPDNLKQDVAEALGLEKWSEVASKFKNVINFSNPLGTSIDNISQEFTWMSDELHPVEQFTEALKKFIETKTQVQFTGDLVDPKKQESAVIEYYEKIIQLIKERAKVIQDANLVNSEISASDSMDKVTKSANESAKAIEAEGKAAKETAKDKNDLADGEENGADGADKLGESAKESEKFLNDLAVARNNAQSKLTSATSLGMDIDTSNVVSKIKAIIEQIDDLTKEVKKNKDTFDESSDDYAERLRQIKGNARTVYSEIPVYQLTASLDKKVMKSIDDEDKQHAKEEEEYYRQEAEAQKAAEEQKRQEIEETFRVKEEAERRAAEEEERYIKEQTAKEVAEYNSDSDTKAIQQLTEARNQLTKYSKELVKAGGYDDYSQASSSLKDYVSQLDKLKVSYEEGTISKEEFEKSVTSLNNQTSLNSYITQLDELIEGYKNGAISEQEFAESYREIKTNAENVISVIKNESVAHSSNSKAAKEDADSSTKSTNDKAKAEKEYLALLQKSANLKSKVGNASSDDDASKDISSSISSFDAKLAEANKSYLDTGDVEAYQTALANLGKEYISLRENVNQYVAASRKSTADDKTRQAQLRKYEQLLQKMEDAQRKWTAAIKGKSSSSYKWIKQDYNELKKLKAQYDANEISIDEFMSRLSALNNKFNQNSKAIKDAGENTKSFGERIKNVVSRFSSYFSVSSVIMSVVRAVKEMVSTSIEIDESMTQLKIVTGATDAEMQKFADTASDMAKSLGQSIPDVLSSIETFSRLGYNLSESSDLAEFANILANVASVDLSEATTGLTSIIKGFNFDVSDVEHVSDVLVELGQNYAVSASEMMTAYEKSSAALAATGTSFEKSAGLIAAANAAVQDASTVGTALKTISARIRGATTDLEDMGEETDDLADGFSEYADELKALTGFDIIKEGTVDEYKDLYDIFAGISSVWDNLSDTSQARVSEILGGTRQLQVVSSIMSNWGDAESAYADAMDSTGVAAEANAEYMNSVTAHIAQFKATFEELSQNAISTDLMNSIVDLGTRAIEVLEKVFDLLNQIGGLGTAGGIVTAVAAVKNITPIINQFSSSGGLAGGIFKVAQVLGDLTGMNIELPSIDDSEMEESVNTLEDNVNEVKDTYEGLKDIVDNVQGVLDSASETGETEELAANTVGQQENAAARSENAEAATAEASATSANIAVEEADATANVESAASEVADTTATEANTAATMEETAAETADVAMTEADTIANVENAGAETGATVATEAHAAANATLAESSGAAAGAEATQTTATVGLTVAEGAATGSTLTLSAAFKALAASFLPLLAVTGMVIAISALIKKIDEETHALENQREEVEELQDDYDELVATGSEYDTLISKEGELTEQEKKRLDVLKEIVAAKKEELALAKKEEIEEFQKRYDNKYSNSVFVEDPNGDAIYDSNGTYLGEGHMEYYSEIERISHDTANTLNDLNTQYSSGLISQDEYVSGMREVLTTNEDLYNSLIDYRDNYGMDLTAEEEDFVGMYESIATVTSKLSDTIEEKSKIIAEYGSLENYEKESKASNLVKQYEEAKEAVEEYTGAIRSATSIDNVYKLQSAHLAATESMQELYEQIKTAAEEAGLTAEEYMERFSDSCSDTRKKMLDLTAAERKQSSYMDKVKTAFKNGKATALELDNAEQQLIQAQKELAEATKAYETEAAEIAKQKHQEQIESLTSLEDELEAATTKLEAYKTAMEGGEKDDAAVEYNDAWDAAIEDIEAGKNDSNTVHRAVELFLDEDARRQLGYDTEKEAEALHTTFYQKVFGAVDSDENDIDEFGATFASYLNDVKDQIPDDILKVESVGDGIEITYSSIEELAGAISDLNGGVPISVEMLTALMNSMDEFGGQSIVGTTDLAALAEELNLVGENTTTAEEAFEDLVTQMHEGGSSEEEISSMVQSLNEYLHDIDSDVNFDEIITSSEALGDAIYAIVNASDEAKEEADAAFSEIAQQIGAVEGTAQTADGALQLLINNLVTEGASVDEAVEAISKFNEYLQSHPEVGFDFSGDLEQLDTLRQTIQETKDTADNNEAELQLSYNEASSGLDEATTLLDTYIANYATTPIESTLTANIDGITSQLTNAQNSINSFVANNSNRKVFLSLVYGWGGLASGTLNKRASGTLRKGHSDAPGTLGKYGTEPVNSPDTLVGELGPEMVVSGNQYRIVGQRGAEFTDIRKGDIVFDAEDTAKLLQGKSGVRGQALVNGTGEARSQATIPLSTINSINTSSPTSSGSSSSSSDSSSDSDEETWFEKMYKLHQHYVAMDQESMRDYLSWLNEAYQQAYNEGILELDDYYQYQEEVFDGLRDLFDDYLNDNEFSIDLLSRSEGNKKKIEEIYLQLIADIQEQLQEAYAYGLDQNDDYVQELIGKMNDYYDEVEDAREEAEEDSKDTIDDLVQYRIKMIKQELEEEKDSYSDRLSDLKDFIDEQKDLLQDEADEEDYYEEQAEKRKAVSDLQAQLDQLEYDNSAWAQKKRLELEEDLADAKDELDKFERDHAIEAAQEEYDAIYDAAEEYTDSQTDLLDQQLNDASILYNQALDDVKNNSQALFDEMVQYELKYGAGVADEVEQMWEDAYKAMQDYVDLYNSFYDDIVIKNYTNYTKNGIDYSLPNSSNGYGISSYTGSITGTTGTITGTTSGSTSTVSSTPSLTTGSYVDVKSGTKWYADSTGGGDWGWAHGGTIKYVNTAGSHPYNIDGAGWVRLQDIVGYAKGTADATAGLHAFDEDGSEYIFSSSDGNKYKMFNSGDKVLSADAADFLYNFANSGNGLEKLFSGMADVLANASKESSPVNIAMGDINISGNADKSTVSEIRRAQRENMDYVLRSLNKLNK